MRGKQRLPWWLMGKESACNAGDTGDKGLIPGPERSLGEGYGNPLQYSCLGNPMDRGAWWLQSNGFQRVGHKWSRAQRDTEQEIRHWVSCRPEGVSGTLCSRPGPIRMKSQWCPRRKGGISQSKQAPGQAPGKTKPWPSTPGVWKGGCPIPGYTLVPALVEFIV